MMPQCATPDSIPKARDPAAGAADVMAGFTGNRLQYAGSCAACRSHSHDRYRCSGLFSEKPLGCAVCSRKTDQRVCEPQKTHLATDRSRKARLVPSRRLRWMYGPK